MKIKADWGLIRADIVIAGVFCLVAAGGLIKKLKLDNPYTNDFPWGAFWLAFAALMMFFCWRLFSDFAKALWRALSISKAPSSLARSSEISGPRLLSAKRDRGLPRP